MALLNTSVHDQFRLKDFLDVAVPRAVVKDLWQELGSYEVRFTEQITLGYGIGNMETAEGRIYGVLKTAADAIISGKMKIIVTDVSGTTLVPRAQEWTTDLLNQGATDMTKRIVHNDQGYNIDRERFIKIMFLPDADVTIDYSKSELILSMTRHSK